MQIRGEAKDGALTPAQVGFQVGKCCGKSHNWICCWVVNVVNDINIQKYRYSIIKSFGFESIPQQLNTNVIRGIVKRAQLL